MTTTITKKYPRARVSRHATLNGWVIDLIQRDGAKPKRVAATYSSIAWADRAARLKLGLKPAPMPPRERVQPPAAPEPPAPASPRPVPVTVDAGTCIPCGRPMRPAGAKAADHPGTTQRQREGLCQPCNQRIKREADAA